MKLKFAIPLAAALCALASAAVAADHEAGVPLSPQEAAGVWTLESRGHSVCEISLSADKAATPHGDCGGLLPGGVAGWVPVSDGMALTDASGQVLLPFDRWSNSLFVAKIATGDEVQLMRGGPNPH